MGHTGIGPIATIFSLNTIGHWPCWTFVSSAALDRANMDWLFQAFETGTCFSGSGDRFTLGTCQ